MSAKSNNFSGSS